MIFYGNDIVNEYLKETPSIDYMNPLIQEKVGQLRNQSEDEIDYIKRSYLFVRDEIPHSWDIKTILFQEQLVMHLKIRLVCAG